MAIDKDLILKLRGLSHAGFADCKKALEETNNDIQEAIKWLRKKGIAKATDKYALKDAKEGGTWVKKDENGIALIELNSETDFVANSEGFGTLANSIVNTILENKVDDLEAVKNLKLSSGESVSESCLHLSSITGEKIVLNRVKYVSVSAEETASCYRHTNGRISALLIFDKKFDEDLAFKLAVHYAANSPKFITADQVDERWVASEKEIILALLEKENKPAEYRDNIIEQRLKKTILKETLMEQDFLYDTSKKIKDVLKELGASIKIAMFFALGESR
ncbi:translation elongation factor Ts [Candidatus Mycoplasma haematobovis]|uniref:Elongation factor Ts n=1 Tax=Candidatus Mycoplasma haematobovis TaxID=432608 RepID=A0A1A9QEA9_9MOLU|nr:translation elongation factor Ts [Candidatus Mycoplasma haematobovis]OAL10341.1 translation elongation factor Ts [Candidatus Mycoplasma haematobovis]